MILSVISDEKKLLNEQSCPVRFLKHDCRMPHVQVDFVYSACIRILAFICYSVFLKVTLSIACKFATVSHNYRDQCLGFSFSCEWIWLKKNSKSVHCRKKAFVFIAS